MVFVLVLLTAATFVAINLIIRKEDRVYQEAKSSKNVAIFLSPEKSLKHLKMDKEKLFHLSHSWAVKSDDGFAYVGYDDFVSTIFSSDIRLNDLPLVGTHVPQGVKIWDVKQDGHKVEQLAPIAGEVVAINPACFADMPLPSDKVEKSWIIKMKTDNFENDSHNLMNGDQALILNAALRDELVHMLHGDAYLNDGGKIDASFINTMTNEKWQEIVSKFFPYQKSL